MSIQPDPDSYPWLRQVDGRWEADTRGTTIAEGERRLVIMQELSSGRLRLAAPSVSQQETGERERHEESMARGLALQADFIASVRTALGARGSEFTDRQIWQEGLSLGPIEPADLASRLLASAPSQPEGVYGTGRARR